MKLNDYFLLHTYIICITNTYDRTIVKLLSIIDMTLTDLVIKRTGYGPGSVSVT